MNEGINLKVILGLIVMVVLLFFGANYLTKKMSQPKNNSTDINTTAQNQNTETENTPTTEEKEAVEQKQDLTNVDHKTALDKSIVLLGEADGVIGKWQAGLGFYNLTIELPTDLSVGKSKQTFSYGSIDNQDYWFTVSFSEENSKYIRAILPKEDYLGKKLDPINKSYWKINYMQAFQIAEKFKGSAFKKDKVLKSVSLSLSQNEPKGWLWWVINYTLSDDNEMEVRVNANNGDIYDNEGNLIVTLDTLSPSQTGQANTNE